MVAVSKAVKRIVLRCDASAEIGAGHLMRCATLARALASCGVEATLAANEDARAFRLPEAVPDMIHLPEGDRDDAAALLGRVPGADMVIVDHYGLGRVYEQALSKGGARVAAMDDLPARPHACELLLDSTAGRTRQIYSELLPPDADGLFGADYALLRTEFRQARGRLGKLARQRPVILAAMGATDPNNATARVLEGLRLVRAPFELVVVLAGAAPHRPALEAEISAWPGPARLVSDPESISALLADTDLAIGAPGVSAAERACMGVAQVLLHTAGNQSDVGASLARAGAAIDLGPAEAAAPARIAAVVESLLADAGARAHLAQAGRTLFDGDGAARVAAAIVSDARAADGRRTVSRRVRASDAAMMLDWQRDPQTRRFARNPRVPDTVEHREWVARRVADPVAVTEILLHREEPAGVLRLDPHADGLEVSIVIAPGHRRKGIGAAALKLARCLRPQARLIAHVFPENTASQTLFAKAGYRPHAGEYLSQMPLEPAGLAA